MNNQNYNRRKFLQLGGMSLATSALLPAFSYRYESESKIDSFSEDGDDKIRLFSNENPYGPSPKVQEVILQELSRVNRYSSFYKYDTNHLIEAIAKKHNLENNQVVVGHGSIDVLRMMTRAFGQTKNSLIMPEVTFNVIGRFADKVFDHKQIKIPLNANMEIDLENTEAAITPETQLVFICNPNNPTGHVLDNKKLENFCKRVATASRVVAIDEAYIELLDPSARPRTVKLLTEKFNVLIIRTFSKAHGLAGLRIGYVMGLPETIERIKNQHYSYPGLLNNIGVAAAITSLEDEAYLAEYRAKNNTVRAYTQNALSDLGVEFLPSQTNFIFLKIQDIKRYREGLAKYKISPVGSPSAYPEWSRISVSDQKDMEHYISAVRSLDWLVKK